MKTLEQILDNMSYTYEDCPTMEKLEEMIQEQMPDYIVNVFDMDGEYSAAGDTIAAIIRGKFVEDMQTEMWNADDQSVYYYVVAIKIKGE